MKNFTIIFLFHILINPLFGQNTLDCDITLPQEKIYLHTDRDLYISGEKIWFKAYCIENDKLKSEFSKVLYIELYDSKKNIYIQKKYKLSNGSAYGNIRIPNDINSGNYFLRAYTLYQRNFPIENFYNQVVSIMNPKNELQELEKSNKSNMYSTKVSNNLQSPYTLKINTSKRKYHQREKIYLNIEEVDKIINLSISVRIKGSGYDNVSLKKFNIKNPWIISSLLFQSTEIDSFYFPKIEKKVPNKIDELKWLPEIRYLTLSGIIRNEKTKKPISNISCITSIIGNTPQIHLTSTKNDGSYIFSYNDLQEEKKIFVGLYNNNNEEETEILINNNFATEFPEIENIPLVYNDNLNKIYETIFLNYQLSRKFNPTSTVNAFSINKDSFPIFNLTKSDININIETYIVLPNLEEILRELVPGVMVYGQRGNRKISIYSKREKRTYKNPLILLDNIPVFDIEKLLLIEPSLLKTIEVFNSKYILGNHILNGIISIKTKTDNYASFKWDNNSVFVTYKTISTPQEFKYPDYSESGINHIPDFRTTLYWNPLINSNNMNTIQFYSSDLCFIYEIIIKGFDSEGNMYFGKTEFEVIK